MINLCAGARRQSRSAKESLRDGRRHEDATCRIIISIEQEMREIKNKKQKKKAITARRCDVFDNKR